MSSSTHDSNTGSGSNPLFTSTYSYDGLGRLASVYIADGRPRTVTFTNNPNGQVLSRIESSAAAKNPADYYYFVDGVQVGELSNNGNHDLSRATYSETFVTRNWNFNQNMTSQPFRWNTTGGVTRGQFGGSGYDPISPTSQGMEGTDGRYQVREGDTLQGIAQQLFGDSSLWYMLAEANGLSGAGARARAGLDTEGSGGAGGIRTLDTLLAYTHFPGERLRPLGHRSACPGRQAHLGARRRQGKAAAKPSIVAGQGDVLGGDSAGAVGARARPPPCSSCSTSRDGGRPSPPPAPTRVMKAKALAKSAKTEVAPDRPPRLVVAPARQRLERRRPVFVAQRHCLAPPFPSMSRG